MDKYQETFQTWNKVAKAYQDKFMDLDLYQDTYDNFLEYIDKDYPSVLEIGCGPGNITKYLLSKRADLNLTGIDISENMIQLAKQNNPSAEFAMMDCRNIRSLEQQYDAIICGFCIPYISEKDLQNLISDCKDLLNESGVLYLSFVEGAYNNSGFITGSGGDRVYFYFYELKNLIEVIEANHFTTCDVISKEYIKADGSVEIHKILIAQKKSGC